MNPESHIYYVHPHIIIFIFIFLFHFLFMFCFFIILFYILYPRLTFPSDSSWTANTWECVNGSGSRGGFSSFTEIHERSVGEREIIASCLIVFLEILLLVDIFLFWSFLQNAGFSARYSWSFIIPCIFCFLACRNKDLPCMTLFHCLTGHL